MGGAATDKGGLLVVFIIYQPCEEMAPEQATAQQRRARTSRARTSPKIRTAYYYNYNTTR
jgi:hypothetical protein